MPDTNVVRLPVKRRRRPAPPIVTIGELVDAADGLAPGAVLPALIQHMEQFKALSDAGCNHGEALRHLAMIGALSTRELFQVRGVSAKRATVIQGGAA